MNKIIIISFVLLLVSCENESKEIVGELKNKNIDSIPNYAVKQDSIINETVEIESVELDQISLIKANFKKLNDNDYWSGIKSVSIEGESTEGGEAKFFYHQNSIEKMVVKIYGETGQITTEYYLMDKALSFIYKQDYAYNTIVYDKDFDFDQSDMIDFRYYFQADTIFKILSSEGGDILYNPPYFEEVTSQQIENFNHYLKMAPAK